MSGSSNRTHPSDRADLSDPSDVEARLWQALRQVEDPEIPVSVVDMGLIVSLAYLPEARLARLKLTFTAMACPAMEMIQDDVRERLLREPEIDSVEIEVVWDPVWSRKRLSEAARARMRELGIAV
jgi:metal-sulfur cluster biosynthetic enzyme